MVTPPGGRLPNGELRRMVARWLADHPGTDVTARDIAADLVRSSGAVGNALRTLVNHGTADQTSTTPLRFRANESTESAAGPTASPPPAAATPKKSTPAKPAKSKTAPKKEKPVTGPVRRPNGQPYHPRKLAGLADVTALRKLRDAGIPALMYGPPGTGKTSVIEAAFPDLITIPGDGDTTVADIAGEYTQTPDRSYVFVHGPLVTAMREGRCLFIDDATLIPPTVLAVVYPAMDGRKEFTVKANGGEIVRAAPGFYVVAGHNPGVHGAVLTDALASRFSAQIQVSTDFDLAKQLGIDSRAIRVASNLATRRGTGDVTWAPQLRELIAFQKIAAVLGTDAAARNLIGIAPEDDRDTVAKLVRDLFKVSAEPLALGNQI
ncbi:AAA family ATPase [Saccharopolyspora sp. ID03-671]|uniref:AAA family ATPase n=1 Tax=Saccharopolyspora sp. ID03-671 TaxID=3073066 RepID=UPI003872E7C1